MFQNAPEDDLVDLAIDLDVPVPEEIDLAGMLDSIVRNLADLGKREGLPFSRYDQEDLEQLEQTERSAIAKLNGVDPSADVDTQISGLLKTGARSTRRTERRGQSPKYHCIYPCSCRLWRDIW